MKKVPNEKRKENPQKKFAGRNQPNPMDPLTNLAKLFILDYAESEVCQLLAKFGFKVQPEHYLIPLPPSLPTRNFTNQPDISVF